MSSEKLLIVEDCEPVAQLIATGLAGRFKEVFTAGTLAAARRHLRLAEGEPFGCVICTHALPDGDGGDFKDWLDQRNDEKNGRTPFILIAGSQPGLRHAEAGFVILPKPFLMSDLSQAVEDARTLTGRPPAT
jgi:CheY-like chemotaxis protein